MKNLCQCHLLQSCDPPCVPYLGMYLTDLAFIEEGTPNYTEDGLVNFSKMRMVSSLQQSGEGEVSSKPEPGPTGALPPGLANLGEPEPCSSCKNSNPLKWRLALACPEPVVPPFPPLTPTG